MPNRLANETSPYLRQHADNPVDWYPWGDEAFAKARAEDKPVLLSVGYSTCPWCHVMAHESFEDPEIAGLMNQWFVSVKVDREERPDVDSVYMTAVQALTGQGGWPMTVFVTPEGKPFFAGTYFPPNDAHGRPGFRRVLAALHDAWVNRRDEVLSSAENVTDHLRRAAWLDTASDGTFAADAPARAVTTLLRSFDSLWGGFGGAPKFPPSSTFEFLLAYAARTGESRAQIEHAAEITLRQMATGGIYDQLGGGFARYSVDERWVVPHFEKMLYDNAQLARLYLHGWQVLGRPLYERVARETLAYLEREMLSPEGGFYSAQDADSEGIEGKFFLWTVEEVRKVLGDGAGGFCRVFGVSEDGNFLDPHHPELTGRNVLTFRFDPEAVAAELGIGRDELDERIAGWRQRMFEAREGRVRPGLDDKVLTSWNGLALAAFAEAARVLGDDHYRTIAEQNAAFVRQHLWKDGVLRHSYKDGEARVEGMLEDYVCYGLGLVELFKATGDIGHLEWARELFEVILARFRDTERGGFFDTADGAEELIIRQRSFFDAATPSENGAAALLATWLARYYGRREWEDVAREVVRQVSEHVEKAPTGFGTILQAMDFLSSPPRELVVVGEPKARAPFERVAAKRFDPWLVLAPGTGKEPLPLFEGRAGDRTARAYLCENMVCHVPAERPEQLESQFPEAIVRSGGD